MTDEELIAELQILLSETTNSEYLLIRDAIVRLSELTAPPPDDAVEVRIAVAAGDGCSQCAIIDQDGTDERQMEFVRTIVCDYTPCVLAEAIITAYIPRRSIPAIPEVVGRVEANP